MSPNDIRAVVKDELGRIAPEVEFEGIDVTLDLREQIDIDSMDFLNLITGLHTRLGIEIPEADYPKLSTLEGVISYLAAATAQRA
jgi:acyl carrier protein